MSDFDFVWSEDEPTTQEQLDKLNAEGQAGAYRILLANESGCLRQGLARTI